MNDPIIDRDDYQKNLRLQQLRAELDAMGYHVVKKDWVRKFGVQQMVADQDRLHNHWNEIKAHISRRMGSDLGTGILDSGAAQITESNVEGIGFTMRAEVSIILRDPQFDKPEWLK